MRKGGKIAVQCASNQIISLKCLFNLNCDFFAKIQTKSTLENLVNIWVFFWKKNVLVTWEGIFNKIEGRKLCRW